MTKLYNTDPFNYNDIAWAQDFYTIKSVVSAVNGKSERFYYSPEFMAASYAFADSENLDEENAVATWELNLDSLIEAGAQFDRADALFQCWVFFRRNAEKNIATANEELGPFLVDIIEPEN